MTEQAPQPPKFPEQLLSSRVIGTVPAEAFAWTDKKPGTPLTVIELIFPEGTVYVTSAGNKKLDKLTEDVRKKDKQTDEFGYSRLDSYFLRACHLEASGEAGNSDRIQQIRRPAPKFEGVTLKDYREGGTPNARRIYYGTTSLGEAKFKSLTHGERMPEGLLLVRVGLADKNNQIDFLYHLTTDKNRKSLKKHGAGM